MLKSCCLILLMSSHNYQTLYITWVVRYTSALKETMSAGFKLLTAAETASAFNAKQVLKANTSIRLSGCMMLSKQMLNITGMRLKFYERLCSVRILM